MKSRVKGKKTQRLISLHRVYLKQCKGVENAAAVAQFTTLVLSLIIYVQTFFEISNIMWTFAQTVILRNDW